MSFWKSNREEAVPRVVIARIEGTSAKTSNGAAAFFIVAGFIAMIAAVVVESSAVRLAAWGSIWTGWNVLCAIGVLNSRHLISYTVYRENPPT